MMLQSINFCHVQFSVGKFAHDIIPLTHNRNRYMVRVKGELYNGKASYHSNRL